MGETKDARALIEAVPTSSLASKLRTLMPAIGRRIGAVVSHHLSVFDIEINARSGMPKGHRAGRQHYVGNRRD